MTEYAEYIQIKQKISLRESTRSHQKRKQNKNIEENLQDEEDGIQHIHLPITEV